MPAPILLGESDFLRLREDGALYVDKTALVREVIDAPARVLLYPRPRRFGKTLNLTMLRAFFEVGPDRAGQFAGLKVSGDPIAMAHFQRHPVICLTFKAMKQRRWAEAELALREICAAEVDRHLAAWSDPRVPKTLRDKLEAVRCGGGNAGGCLEALTEALHIHHGEAVVTLIDEYDACILTSWQEGYFEEAVAFFRALLGGGLKDSRHLYKAVLTGILRVAKESLFSGLNNVVVYSLLHERELEPFGFSEPEVMALLAEFGRSAEEDAFRSWYNGYRFGSTVVYNPWSVLSALANPPLLHVRGVGRERGRSDRSAAPGGALRGRRAGRGNSDADGAAPRLHSRRCPRPE